MAKLAKLSRTRDQRQALIKSLATALVEREKITTTKPKAKAVGPYFERVVSTAKRGGLHARRQVLAALSTEAATRKLFDELLPRFDKRNSGFVSIKAAGWRRGDNAELATVSLTVAAPIKPAESKPAAKPAASPAKTSSDNQAKESK